MTDVTVSVVFDRGYGRYSPLSVCFSFRVMRLR